MKADLTYKKRDAMFTSFWPETPQGKTAWNEIASKNDGVANVLHHQAPALIEQLRAAGYSVRASK